MPTSRRRPLLLLFTLLALAAVACIPAAGPVPRLDAENPDARNPFGWMEGGKPWLGDFPDPHIMREGSTYYAYATNSSGRHMPVLQSTDLVTWRSPSRYTTAPAPWLGGGDPYSDPAIPVEIRKAGLDAGDTWNMNDALVTSPIWATSQRKAVPGCGARESSSGETRSPCLLGAAQGSEPSISRTGSLTDPTTTSSPTGSTTTSTTLPAPTTPSWPDKETWAPGVIKIGSRFYAYSAVAAARPAGVEYGRFCIAVARSTSPRGPFRDISGPTPILCDTDPGGSIDPYPFRDPKTGQYWLYWKATGFAGASGRPSYPSSLKAIRLDRNGRPYGAVTKLLETAKGSWEGYSIENPGMVYWKGVYWLFYSGNKFVLRPNGTSRYATGYAVCAGPAGPCRRPSALPLLASSEAEVGPGGGSPIVDRSNRLRLAIHFFWPGDWRDTGTPRRLKVLTLQKVGADRLRVVRE